MTYVDADMDADMDKNLYGPELLKALKREHHVKKTDELYECSPQNDPYFIGWQTSTPLNYGIRGRTLM